MYISVVSTTRIGISITNNSVISKTCKHKLLYPNTDQNKHKEFKSIGNFSNVRMLRVGGGYSLGCETRLNKLSSIVACSLLGRNSGGIHGSSWRRWRKRISDNKDEYDPDHQEEEEEEHVDASSSTSNEPEIGQVGNQERHENSDSKDKIGSTLEEVKSKELKRSKSSKDLTQESKNEKNPTSKKLKKGKSSKALKLSSHEQPAFTEVAPVAETILTNPELFDSESSEGQSQEEIKDHCDEKTSINSENKIYSFLKDSGLEEDSKEKSNEENEGNNKKQSSENSHVTIKEFKAGDNDTLMGKEVALDEEGITEALSCSNSNINDANNGKQMVEEKVAETQEGIDESSMDEEKVGGTVRQVTDQVVQIGQKVIDKVSETLPDPIVEQVEHVAGQVTEVAEQIATTASQVTDTVSHKIADILGSDDDEETEDEFEVYRASDLPGFKGKSGMENFTVFQEEQGLMAAVYDIYSYMLKSSLLEFSLAMFAAPIILSMIFTLLYIPELSGLTFEETARQFFQYNAEETKEVLSIGLQFSLTSLFQVFMFSVSLSTGLQPELAPLSPYTLVVANLNALLAQLLFVFMSGAVFARLSQPSQPVRFSTVALMHPNNSRRKQGKNAQRVLMARYVLAGPQPCELVDVKVDLTYKYNTVTSTGTFFRATQSLKLVRTEVAYLNHGMLVRHVIDESSPLYKRTPAMLKKEDAIFVLSVIGLDRSSMQPVFHVQHYCIYDGDVIWDAEFEDIIMVSKKNKLIMDHSKLNQWRPVYPNSSNSSNA